MVTVLRTSKGKVFLTDAFIYRPIHGSTCWDFRRTNRAKAFQGNCTGNTDDLGAVSNPYVVSSLTSTCTVHDVTIRRKTAFVRILIIIGQARKVEIV
jgi:hypothetical protein